MDLELALLQKQVVVEIVNGRLSIAALLVQYVAAGLLVHVAVDTNGNDAAVLDELIIQMLLQIRILIATRQIANLDHTQRIVELRSSAFDTNVVVWRLLWTYMHWAVGELYLVEHLAGRECFSLKSRAVEDRDSGLDVSRRF